jgi:hypothetical protein
MKTAEKMNKAQLQEEKQRREQPQQKERISLTITSASNKVTTCPRCSNTNTAGSKYCNNCGFRFADAGKEEEGTTMKQRPLSPSSSSSSLIKTAEQNVVKFVTWESPTHGVKINYPSNWRVEYGLKPPLFVAFKSPKESPSDTVLESVFIGLNAIPNITLEEYIRVQINNLKTKCPHCPIIESVFITLKGQQAHMIVFDRNGRRVKHVHTIRGNKLYRIVYNAEISKYDSYLPIVQKMLDSFEITANR